MQLTLICGTNTVLTSQLCGMLSALGFYGFAPYSDKTKDGRFRLFESARLNDLIKNFDSSVTLDRWRLIKQFSEELSLEAQSKNNNGFYLSHPQLYRLISFLKHEFDIRVVFALDSLLEPSSELEIDDWKVYYQQRDKFLNAIAGLIENQHFPFIFISSSELFSNHVNIFKKLLYFHKLKLKHDVNTFNFLHRESNKLAQSTSKRIQQLNKVAVVTAYAKESTETLLKCIASVKNQTFANTHILIADGYPNTELIKLVDENFLHISLPINIGFNQCGVGIELAFALGFDVVCILDADNWFEPDHIASALNLINEQNADVVFARRKIIFPDGEILSVNDPQDNTGAFADTNCMVLTKRAAAVTPVWLMWPKLFGAGEDRAVSIIIRLLNFNVVMNTHDTVWYQTNWSHHYKLQNKKPVAPLRKPAAELAYSFNRKIFFEATGFNLPIKQAADVRSDNTIDLNNIAIVLSHDTNSHVIDLRNISNDYNTLIMHHGNFSRTDAGNIKQMYLPYHQDFIYTAWSLGASVMFQKGCDIVGFISSSNSFDEVNFSAMLQQCEQSSLDVVICSKDNEGINYLVGSLVTKKAKFFAVIWNQLRHIEPVYRVRACENYLSQKNIRFIHLKLNESI